MVEFDPKRCKFPPRPYQVAGVKQLLKRPRYGLFWEMRLGKCKAVIDTACVLFEAGELDVVVVACPAQVKGVWLDKEYGEIQKHTWSAVSIVMDYNSRFERHINEWAKSKNGWIVTSYEFLRQENANGDFVKVEQLMVALRGLRYWLVCDEMAALGNYKALQTRAVRRLAEGAARVCGLDGTPIGNSPMEQYSKFSVLGTEILGYKNFFQFRARHAIVKRVPWTKSGQVVGFQGQAAIDSKVKPYCEYLSQDGLDLPEKIPTFFSVALDPKTWKLYESMRDELIAELDQGTVTANHAAVKALRLAQLCAGFLGGLVDDPWDNVRSNNPGSTVSTVEVSRESTDAFLSWLALRLKERPDFKCVVWCRWRAEIERLSRELQNEYGPSRLRAGVTYGAKKDANFLHPDHLGDIAGVMICQPQAAQFGVSFAKADTEVFLSQDYNRVSRAQSEERVQGVGIRRSTSVVDVLVTGPQGERTIVHDILRSLRDKEEIARRTVSAWRKAIA